VDGREARNLEALHNNEDVIGISFISVKRQLHHTTSKQSEQPGNEVFKEQRDKVKHIGVIRKTNVKLSHHKNFMPIYLMKNEMPFVHHTIK
jgi:hypothetical protein